MPRIGPVELVLILVIVLVIFGAGKLPEIGKSLGKGIREFKKAQEGEDEASTKKTQTTSASSTTVASSSRPTDQENHSDSDSP